MSIVKSLSVGDGDMFYIRHGSDSFTMIDCCIAEDEKDRIIEELKSRAAGKGIIRFISTHPDDDHIQGLGHLDAAFGIQNFYCVANEATKTLPTNSFKKYCELRDDSQKAFHLVRKCSRRWLNKSDDERKGAGLGILWPDTSSEHFQEALAAAKNGQSPNNISCIVKYELNNGVTILWMGDLEKDFMEKIEGEIEIGEADILFAPHHGRDTGRVPAGWLKDMNPSMIVIGEAPSKDLNYYGGFNTITQNSAGDITLECESGKVHIYVSNPKYAVDFLENEYQTDSYGHYIGTLLT